MSSTPTKLLVCAPLALAAVTGFAQRTINLAGPSQQVSGVLPPVNGGYPLQGYKGAYSDSTSYAIGDRVFYANQYWESLVVGNKGNTPSSSSSSWAAFTGPLVDPATVTAAQNAANAALPVSGGQMTGSLLLSSDPTANTQAATKNYVDTHAGTGTGSVSDATVVADITLPKYASSCGTSALDTTGSASALCIIRAAIADAESATTTGNRIVLLPAGVLNVQTDTPLEPSFSMTQRVSFRGAGEQLTTLMPGDSTGDLFQYSGAGLGPCGANSVGQSQCEIEIHDFAVRGNRLTTTGTVFNIYNMSIIHMWNISVREVNGFCLNLVNNTERSHFTDINCDGTLGISEVGDTNEHYYDTVNVTSSGLFDGNLCAAVPNCNPSTHQFNTSGTWLPNYNAAVRLSGVNVDWQHSSIKATTALAGFQFGPEAQRFANNYVEGYATYNLNPAVIVGAGRLPFATITTSVGATDTQIQLDQTQWMRPYVTSPTLAPTVQVGAGMSSGCIYPTDYDISNTSQSTAVPAVKRNYCEPINVAAFAGNNKVYLQGNRSGIAWPAGSRVEMFPVEPYGNSTMQTNHINSIDDPVTWPSGVVNGCDDTYNPCADVLVGAIADGFTIPYMWQAKPHSCGSLTVMDGSFFFNTAPTSALTGSGWIKIPLCGDVSIVGNAEPLFAAPTNPLQYVNGLTRVRIVKDIQGDTAQAAIRDPGGFFFQKIAQNVYDDWWAQYSPGAGTPLNHVVSAPPSTLTSLSVSLSASSLAVGGQAAISCLATYTDGSTIYCSGQTYASSSTATATISGSTITAVAAGTTSVTASQAGVTSSPVTLTVTAK